MAFFSSDSYHTVTTAHTFYNNIPYGNTNREVMDIWVPNTAGPHPMVVYFHGGGFIVGDKTSIPEATVNDYIDNDIAVASCNYPYVKSYVDTEGIKKCMLAGVGAVDFLKANATFLNLNTNAFIASGGSAGAGIAGYLAYWDHSSNNVIAVVLRNPQAGYWYPQWEEFIAVDGFDVLAIYDAIPYEKQSVNRTMVISEYSELSEEPLLSYRTDYYDFITQIGNGDSVPTRLECTNIFYTELEGIQVPDVVHSPYHGKALRDALIDASVEVLADINGIGDTTGGVSELNFIINQIP